MGDTLFPFSFYQICWYFFVYAFMGWCLEVVFCSVQTGKFVNRGFLNGPVCPIYGFGGTLVILLLTPVSGNLFVLFAASVLVTSTLELVTGFLLGKLFHTHWWDYSNEPFNIGGYICLKFSLAWGVACIFLMRILHPAVSLAIDLIPIFIGNILLVIMFILLTLDTMVTVAAIRKLNRDLGEITHLAQLMHQNSEFLAEKLGNRAISLAGRVDELELDEKMQAFSKKIEEKRDSWEDTLQEQRVKAGQQWQKGKDKLLSSLDMDSLDSRRKQLLSNKNFVRNRLLKAFPDMQHHRYSKALEDLKHFRFFEKNNAKIENNPESTPAASPAQELLQGEESKPADSSRALHDTREKNTRNSTHTPPETTNTHSREDSDSQR